MNKNVKLEPGAAPTNEFEVVPPTVIDKLKVPAIEPASPNKPAPVHLAYLDGLRAMAALYVVIYHVFAMVDSRGDGYKGLAKIGEQIFWFGHQAVGLFIVLSGFCLMIPVARNKGEFRGGLVTFFKKRAMRILPPYYFALAFSWLVILGIQATGQKPQGLLFFQSNISLWGLVTHILMIHDLFLDTLPQFNGVLWSVAVEWRIYFIFPLLVLLQRRIGIFATVALATVVGYSLFEPLCQLGLNAFPANNTGISPHYVGLFTMGMLATMICFSDSGTLADLKRKVPWRVVSWVFFVLAAVLCKVPIAGYRVPLAYSDLAVGLWSTALLITLYVDPRTLMHRVLQQRLFVFAGTFAYSLYLIHTPLLQFIWQCGISRLGLGFNAALLVELVIAVPLVIGAAYVFFLGCEKPFIQAKNRVPSASFPPARDNNVPVKQEG